MHSKNNKSISRIKALHLFIAECKEFDIVIPEFVQGLLSSQRSQVALSECSCNVLDDVENILLKHHLISFGSNSLLDCLTGGSIAIWHGPQSLLCYIFLQLLPNRGVYTITSKSQYEVIIERFRNEELKKYKQNSLKTSYIRGPSAKYSHIIDEIIAVLKKAP